MFVLLSEWLAKEIGSNTLGTCFVGINFTITVLVISLSIIPYQKTSELLPEQIYNQVLNNLGIKKDLFLFGIIDGLSAILLFILPVRRYSDFIQLVLLLTTLTFTLWYVYKILKSFSSLSFVIPAIRKNLDVGYAKLDKKNEIENTNLEISLPHLRQEIYNKIIQVPNYKMQNSNNQFLDESFDVQVFTFGMIPYYSLIKQALKTTDLIAFAKSIDAVHDELRRNVLWMQKYSNPSSALIFNHFDEMALIMDTLHDCDRNASSFLKIYIGSVVNTLLIPICNYPLVSRVYAVSLKLCAKIWNQIDDDNVLYNHFNIFASLFPTELNSFDLSAQIIHCDEAVNQIAIKMIGKKNVIPKAASNDFFLRYIHFLFAPERIDKYDDYGLPDLEKSLTYIFPLPEKNIFLSGVSDSFQMNYYSIRNDLSLSNLCHKYFLSMLNAKSSKTFLSRNTISIISGIITYLGTLNVTGSAKDKINEQLLRIGIDCFIYLENNFVLNINPFKVSFAPSEKNENEFEKEQIFVFMLMILKYIVIPSNRGNRENTFCLYSFLLLLKTVFPSFTIKPQLIESIKNSQLTSRGTSNIDKIKLIELIRCINHEPNFMQELFNEIMQKDHYKDYNYQALGIHQTQYEQLLREYILPYCIKKVISNNEFVSEWASPIYKEGTKEWLIQRGELIQIFNELGLF